MESTSESEFPLENVGWGFYQQGIHAVCCLCVMAEAVALVSAVFTFPVASCDLHLDPDASLWTNAALCIGLALGGPSLGAVGDALGRRLPVPCGLLWAFCSALVICFSVSSVALVLGAFLFGFGLGTVGPSVRTYISEILPKERRGGRLVFIDVCWTFGYLVTSCMWWEVLPTTLLMDNGFRLQSWRVSLALSTCFLVLSACLTAVIRDSPRHLLCKGRKLDAVAELRRMYAINYGRHENDYEPAETLSHCVEEDLEEWLEDYRSCGCSDSCGLLQRASQLWTAVVAETPLRHTTLAAAGATAALFPGCVYLGWWTSRLWFSTSVSWPWWLQPNCNLHSVQDLYWPHVTCGLTAFGALLVLSAAIDKLGRRMCAVPCFCLGSTLSMTLAFPSPFWLRYLQVSLLTASFFCGRAVLSAVIVESFPTRIRATAAGMVEVPFRLIMSFVPFIRIIDGRILCFFVGISMMLCAVSMSYLPELRKKPITE